MVNLVCLKALICCTFPQYSQDQDYPDLLWYLSEVKPSLVLCYGNRNHTICYGRAAPQCLGCESNSSGKVGAQGSSGIPVFAPQGLRQLIQHLVIVMKMLRVKPKGVSRWVGAGLYWDLDYLQYSGNRSSRWFCLGQELSL